MNAKTTIISVLAGSLLAFSFGTDLMGRSPNSQDFSFRNQGKSVELAERGSGRREQEPQPNFLAKSRLS